MWYVYQKISTVSLNIFVRLLFPISRGARKSCLVHNSGQYHSSVMLLVAGRVRIWAGSCGIFGEHNDAGTGFIPNILGVSCHCNSPNAPQPFFIFGANLSRMPNIPSLGTSQEK
jgi:hypothetical protein